MAQVLQPVATTTALGRKHVALLRGRRTHHTLSVRRALSDSDASPTSARSEDDRKDDSPEPKASEADELWGNSEEGHVGLSVKASVLAVFGLVVSFLVFRGAGRYFAERDRLPPASPAASIQANPGPASLEARREALQGGRSRVRPARSTVAARQAAQGVSFDGAQGVGAADTAAGASRRGDSVEQVADIARAAADDTAPQAAGGAQLQSTTAAELSGDSEGADPSGHWHPRPSVASVSRGAVPAKEGSSEQAATSQSIGDAEQRSGAASAAHTSPETSSARTAEGAEAAQVVKAEPPGAAEWRDADTEAAWAMEAPRQATPPDVSVEPPQGAVRADEVAALQRDAAAATSAQRAQLAQRAALAASDAARSASSYSAAASNAASQASTAAAQATRVASAARDAAASQSHAEYAAAMERAEELLARAQAAEAEAASAAAAATAHQAIADEQGSFAREVSAAPKAEAPAASLSHSTAWSWVASKSGETQAYLSGLWTQLTTSLSSAWAAFINWTSSLGDYVKRQFFSAGPKGASASV